MKRIRVAGLLGVLAIAAIAVRWWPDERPSPAESLASLAAEPVEAADPVRDVEEAIEISGPAAELASPSESALPERAPPPIQPAAARRSSTIRVEPDLGLFAQWITYDALASTRLESESGDVLLPSKCGGPKSTCCFENVPPGRYQVVVETPLFRTFRSVFVQPGAVVFPLLRGSATVVVSVTDLDGAPIDDYELLVRGDDGNAYQQATLRAKSDPGAPADGAFAVPPGSWTFMASVAGRGTEQAQLLDLRAGETRALDFALERPTRIAGRLVDSRGMPLGRSEVVQLQTRADATSPPAPASRQVIDLRNLNIIHASPEGEFAFEDVLPGEYTLSAWAAPALAATLEVDLEPGGRLEDLELRLPPCAYLEGFVTGPPGARLDAVSLRLGSNDDDGNRRQYVFVPHKESSGRYSLAFQCSASGAFRLGPVAPGRHVLSLAFPPSSRLHSSVLRVDPADSPAQQRITDVDLAAGENRLDLDLTELWPGALEVEVLVEGATAQQGTVVQVFVDGTEDTPIVALTDGDGVARFDKVPCGAVRVVVSPPDFKWRFRMPEPVGVEPAHLERARVEVSLHEGSLRVLRKNGTPLANASVGFGHVIRSNSWGWESYKTDGAGRLTLRLSEGRYLVGKLGEDTEEIEWTDRGPVPAEVELDQE